MERHLFQTIGIVLVLLGFFIFTFLFTQFRTLAAFSSTRDLYKNLLLESSITCDRSCSTLRDVPKIDCELFFWTHIWSFTYWRNIKSVVNGFVCENNLRSFTFEKTKYRIADLIYNFFRKNRKICFKLHEYHYKKVIKQYLLLFIFITTYNWKWNSFLKCKCFVLFCRKRL